eukprot:GFYU01008709.1.p1 GENE.GFYU01008709.1~~GFYU01008709.1.p1  ORF type:complete len:388 (-),score=122.60 GFYU01008709.1:71-1234(-)
MDAGLLSNAPAPRSEAPRKSLLAAVALIGVAVGCVATIAVLSHGSTSTTEATSLNASPYLFSDEFDEFDLSMWKHELTMGGGGNWEFEMYVNNRTNSYVKDSVLYIKPTLTADNIGEANLHSGFTMDMWGSSPADQCTGEHWWGCFRNAGDGGNILPPVQSARLRTAESFNFKYGKVEIRAKLPKGDWLWPAMWLLPRHNAYGNWPASGEIDLVESRGNANGYPEGVQSFASTLHWGPHYPMDPWEKTHKGYTLPQGTFNDDFHVFGLSWTKDRIFTYLDTEDNIVMDVPITDSFWNKGDFASQTSDNPWAGRPNNAPFDQEFYLVFNVAVGGLNSYWPDGQGGKPWSNTGANQVNAFWAAKDQWYPTWDGENAALQVDWVRVSPAQ